MYPHVPMEWQDLDSPPRRLPTRCQPLRRCTSTTLRQADAWEKAFGLLSLTIDGDTINITRLSSGVGMGAYPYLVGSKYPQFDETDLHVCVLHQGMRLASWHETRRARAVKVLVRSTQMIKLKRRRTAPARRPSRRVSRVNGPLRVQTHHDPHHTRARFTANT